MSPKVWFSWFAVCSGFVPAAANAMSMDLHGDRFNLAVRTTANTIQAPVIGSQADLSTDLNGLQLRVQVGIEAGAKPAALQAVGATPFMRLSAWNSSRASLNAVWEPLAGARFELNARNQLRRDFDQPDSIWADFSRRDVSAQESETGATATFGPSTPVNLQIGANASSRTV